MKTCNLLENVKDRARSKIEASKGVLSLKDVERIWRSAAAEMGCEMTEEILNYGKTYSNKIHRKLWLDKHIAV